MVADFVPCATTVGAVTSRSEPAPTSGQTPLRPRRSRWAGPTRARVDAAGDASADRARRLALHVNAGMPETAGELSQSLSRQRRTECSAERLPRRVRVGERAALHRLRRRRHGEALPVPHLHAAHRRTCRSSRPGRGSAPSIPSPGSAAVGTDRPNQRRRSRGCVSFDSCCAVARATITACSGRPRRIATSAMIEALSSCSGFSA